jgi:hypothetical protein
MIAPTNLAPSPRPTDEDHRSRIVLVSGSVTTLAALGGVFAAAHNGVNIMGWYANYIIPAGALLVGLVAASGYGVAAWMTGLKMTRRLVWSVVAELALSYVIAQYEEYRQFSDDGSLAGFFQWFDVVTRSFAFQHGPTLGVLGYGLRALELAGFVAGGALVPIGLRAKPYCDPCRTYKRTRLLAVLPAGPPPKTFGRVDGNAAADAHQAAVAGVQAIFAAASAGDRERLHQEVSARGPLDGKRAARRLTAHATVSVVRCPRCADGGLVASMITGRGNQTRVARLGGVPLEAERVRALFD